MIENYRPRVYYPRSGIEARLIIIAMAMTKASLKSVVDGQNASIQEASSPEPIIKIDTECYRQHVLTRIQTTIVMIQPQHPLRISHVLAVKRSVKVGEKLRGQALIGIE